MSLHDLPCSGSSPRDVSQANQTIGSGTGIAHVPIGRLQARNLWAQVDSCDAQSCDLHIGCEVEVTCFCGDLLFFMKFTDCFDRSLFIQILLPKLLSTVCRNHRLPLHVIAECNPRIHWEVANKTHLSGCLLLDPLNEQQRDDLYTRETPFEVSCFSCYSPCIDADILRTRHKNCIVCEPCFLCDNCRVYIQGAPMCLVCVEEHGELHHLGRFHQARFKLLWSKI